ncbi:terminase small subunit [Clostridium sp. 'White wine YQ']|uniref:terminase small subunit n=1 Tax=Clostridium sp. 'White wine YQ' TaxID=3027474 RepID=UPI00236513CB|nr:terminase small subunit [Clostridium sp. 'White wine YQ']MDD7793682.1 terminase small subunit [Clostridium sp. 'White wine YQ']
MPRSRSPNRDRAFDLYKVKKGAITNREIATILNEDEKKIAVWKQRDKWNENINVVQQKNKSCTTKCKTKKKEVNEKPVVEEVEEVLKNTELTDKQRLFCIHYIKCFNATKAAIKAGYSKDTAGEQGYQLLQKTSIQTEINKLKAYKLNRAMLSEDDIFQKYIDIAFTDISDYMDFGQRKVPMLNPISGEPLLNEDGNPITYTVDFAHFKDSSEVDGTLISEISKGKDGAKLKLQDKMKALRWLSDRMDLLSLETQRKLELENEKLEMIKKKSEPNDEKKETVRIVDDI